MDEKIKSQICDLLTDAEVGIYSPTLIKKLIASFGKQVDTDLLFKSMEWANSEDMLDQYLWWVFCKGILGVEGQYDDYTYNMEVNEVNDSYDYDKDYEEEDFKPITEEELDKLDEQDEIGKYINGNEMNALPPKDLFKKYCIENEEVDLLYGKYEISIDSFYNDEFCLDVDGKFWAGNFDKIYSKLENIDAELEKVISEEKKAQVELEKTKDSIINRIGALNADSTVKDIARIESSIEFYSDYHKDIEGFRPRSDIGEFYRAMERNASKALAEFEALSWDEKVKLMTE